MATSIDFLSPWIKNKQLMQQIEASEWPSVQLDIIENVFHGFESMLHIVLRHRLTLTISEQNILYHSLNKYATNSDDLFENYRNKDKVSITSIADDCLSYIMRFLSPNDRIMMQQCCRLFVVTARQESSVNNVEIEFPLMKMLPFRHSIIDGIQSNDSIKNKKALHFYSKALNMSSSSFHPLRFIQHYSDNIYHKFKTLILNDNTPLAQNISIDIYKQNADPDMIHLMLDHLQNEYRNDLNQELNGNKSNKSNIDEIINTSLKALQTKHTLLHFVGLNAIRELLSHPYKPPTTRISKTRIIPKVISFVYSESGDECIFEAAWIITNIASYCSECALSVIRHGAIEGFVYLLQNTRDQDIMNQAIAGLDHILEQPNQSAERILSCGVLSAFLHIIDDTSNLNISSEIQNNAICATSKVFRHCKGLKLADIKDIVPAIATLLRNNDNGSMIINCLWALYYLSNHNDTIIEYLCTHGAVAICMKYLNKEMNAYGDDDIKNALLKMNCKLYKPCLRILGSVLSSEDHLTQSVLDAGYLDVIGPFTYHSVSSQRKRVIWSLSNILAASSQQIEMVLSRPKLMKSIIDASMCDVMSIRREACWCICNATLNGTTQQKKRFAGYEAIESLCEMLAPNYTMSDLDVRVVTEGLEGFLKVYAQTDGFNPFANKIKRCKGLKYMETRCAASNISEDTCMYIVDLVKRYWS